MRKEIRDNNNITCSPSLGGKGTTSICFHSDLVNKSPYPLKKDGDFLFCIPSSVKDSLDINKT